MFRVDLNSDLGESYGRYTIGMDERIIPLVTSANVACGYHASDPVVMQKTVREAKKAGIGVGAHPGLEEERWQFPRLRPKPIRCISWEPWLPSVRRRELNCSM